MCQSPDTEATESLLPTASDLDEGSFDSPQKALDRSYRGLQALIAANIATFVFLSSILLFQVSRWDHDLNWLLRQTSAYSPILESTEVATFTDRIDGGIAAHSKPSIARLPPGPEADAAWDRFEDIRTVVLSRADVVAMGKDPETAARFPDEHWGFGDDAYMGQLDIVHQLHCLNQLRKRAFAAYLNPEAGKEANRGPQWRWVHLQHCVSILLENLMCHADTELLTMNWIHEAEYPFPDFSINRKWRSFDAVLDWQAARVVDMERWMNMTKPTGGVTVIAGEREWFAVVASDAAGAAADAH